MKKITVTLDDTTALALLALLVDKNVDSVHMESVVPEKPTRAFRHRKLRATGAYMAPADPNRMTLHKALSNAFTPGKVFTHAEAEKEIVKHGYAPTGAGATLSRLRILGFLERDGDNYKFAKSLPPGWRMPYRKFRKGAAAQRELAL